VLLGGKGDAVDGGDGYGLEGLLASLCEEIVGSVAGNGLAIDGVDNHGFGIGGEVAGGKSDDVMRTRLNFDAFFGSGEKLSRDQLVESDAFVSVLEMGSGIGLSNDGARHFV